MAMTVIGAANGDSNEHIRSIKSAILRIGTERLGPPPTDIQDKLHQILDLSKLKAMADCLLTVQRWGDLFAE